MPRNPTPRPVAAIGYARHSTVKQSASVGQQVDSFKAYCAANHIPLEKVFADEGKSGKSLAHRDAAEELIEYVGGAPSATVLLLWDASRLGRNIDETQYLRAIVRKAGLTIIYTGDESLNTPGKEQRIVEALADYRSDLFRSDLAKNVKRGMLASLRRGHYVSGRPPKCYKLKRDGEITRLIPDPRLWERGQRAWELRAAGSSIRIIHEQTRLFARQSAYWHFFTNPIYKGEYTFLNETIDGFCKPLCTPAQWQAVAARVTTYTPRASRAEHLDKYAFSGLVYCSICGRLRRGSDNNYHGKKGAGRYYRCAWSNPAKDERCRAGYIRAEVLHAAVIDALKTELTAERIAPQYAKWLKAQKKSSATRKRQLADLRAKLRATDDAIRNLTAAVESGGANITALVTRLAAQQATAAELRAKHDALLAAPEPAPMNIVARVEELRARIFTTPPDYVLMRSVIARIDATPSEITVTLRQFWE